MVRVEFALPTKNQHHRDVDPDVIDHILCEVGNRCGGYRINRQFGFWKPETGESHPEIVWLLVTDTSLENANWFQKKRKQWQNDLDQKEIYLAVHIVEWL